MSNQHNQPKLLKGRQKALNDALLYQDVNVINLLSSARTFIQGLIAYGSIRETEAVMGGEWVEALDAFCARTGVKLYE